MSNVIELNDYRKVWINTEIKCSVCDKKWIATYHKDTFALECPKCNMMNIIRKASTYGEYYDAFRYACSRLGHRVSKSIKP